MEAPSSFPGALDQLARIFDTIVVATLALFLGAALAGWFVVVVGVATRTEATRARDGKQLLILALNICWAPLAWFLFGLKLLVDFNNESGRASTGIVFCAPLVPTIVVMRIRRERARQLKWLRSLEEASEESEDEAEDEAEGEAEGEGEAGATPQFVIERVECFPNAEQIPPYLSNSLGRYTGILVRTDQTSGAREILGRVR